MVPDLPPVLRTYVGCASRLYGEVEAADLVKIHVQSGKLTLTIYDDLEGKPLPRLIERVKINLRSQTVQFFDYDNEPGTHVLYHKARYIPSSFEGFAAQQGFDEALLATGAIDAGPIGPTLEELEHTLDRQGVQISTFHVMMRQTRR
jgi:DNA phosphorothioation-associated putative methyltransferase